MNVLVYSGPEALQPSVSRTITALRLVLYPHYTTQTITLQSLTSQPWSKSCTLLVFPACRDHLSLPSAVIANIKTYVEDGGALLCLRAGAKYGGSLFETGDYSLRFQHSRTGASIYCSFLPGGDDTSRRIAITTEDGTVVSGIVESGAADFETINDSRVARILARNAEDNRVVAAELDVGAGKIALWGAQLEVPIVTEDGAAEARLAEERRRELFTKTLLSLGLELPPPSTSQPPYPLPQFLVSIPSKPDIVGRILQSLELTPPATLKDANDSFVFHDALEGDSLLLQARSSSGQDNTRHIVVYGNGSLPPTTLTPLFNVQQYFVDLAAAREKAGSTTAEPWAVGEAFLYSEAVTSTQTLLDRNPRLLASLPAPLVSLATYQLAGRGRGGNAWVSPLGCLQFSLRLHVSLSALPPARLVFVQYLVALAVVEAARDDGVLGRWGGRVRIKWPNDVYVIGEAGGEKPTKASGILVYTSMDGDGVDIIIGCGINLLNPPPIASLASIIPPGAHEQPTMERTTAILMTKFEALWSTFIANRGSFEPFMDRYYDYWLHSDQVVTLTTTTPHRLVRIVGITSDYGLLRTIPESGGYGASQDFIDLQPDGNSFDLMSGMIMTKTR